MPLVGPYRLRDPCSGGRAPRPCLEPHIVLRGTCRVIVPMELTDHGVMSGTWADLCTVGRLAAKALLRRKGWARR